MSDEHKPDQNNDENLYKAYMMKTKNDIHTSPTLSEEEQREIIRVGSNTARNATVMISLAILLLILPLMTLITYLYYGIGGKANTMIDVVGKTIYVTEPNISLEEMEIESEIGLFSMNVKFDTFKRIGSEDYLAEKVDVYFGLDEPKFPEKISFLEQLPPMGYGIDVVKDGQKMYHPDAMVPFNTPEAWDVLDGLPDGTVAEAYLSFSQLINPDDIDAFLPKETEIRWLAVDTGLEAEQLDKEGVPITPIGYPAQVDTTTWSPFNGRDQTNEEVFLDILKLLEKNEETAEVVSKIKSLEIKERRKYVEDKGIHIYGAVVTGPIPELRKLEQVKEIRAAKVGEIKLWNLK
ncbi:anti-sigma factor [Fictibacillus norfolkensis]|uniref:Anti sigma factor C-terminal domain-containing protein n=1 Tax=Fictibacillus norfolkensis TaxID=2762233 RepID=A0ABR8SKE0_9BACL|nr:anti-sigma factor [Fictibacillus norfolkensis]MBD7963951.1 anti sigma factor C-terminal domain-containing protein [Fictibacillus norfolkensis]